MQKLKQSILAGTNTNSIIESQAKSKMRIQIETFLIELNEEIYTISEDLANNSQSLKQDMHKKAKDYERRTNLLLRKI